MLGWMDGLMDEWMLTLMSLILGLFMWFSVQLSSATF